MAKFNRKLKKKNQHIIPYGPNTLNRAGGFAFQDSESMALYRQIATSLWSGDGYYENEEAWFKRFQENVRVVMRTDPRLPFALAAYARDKAGLALRTSPVALYVEAASQPEAKGTGLIRQYAPKILKRADEPAEAIAYYRQHHGGSVPHGLLRGIADILPNFDEYQLAKYKKTGSVSMRDVFRLARPKPKDENQEILWHYVVKNELKPAYTWEVELSKCQGDDEKREKWNELIHSGRLGLMALMRNMRSILRLGADIEEALGQITPERVRASGILPFQWYKAYQSIAESGHEVIARVMEEALAWSLDNVPKLPGITLMACDNSGSMEYFQVTRGTSCMTIANLMGAMGVYCCDQGFVGTFGETFAMARTEQHFNLFKNKSIIEENGRRTGQATNAWTIFAYLIKHRIFVDRVIIFSDMQCYDSSAYVRGKKIFSHTLAGELDAYAAINPNVLVYSVNLASQDNSCQFAPHQRVVELAGWSESVFKFINSMEVGDGILNKILETY